MTRSLAGTGRHHHGASRILVVTFYYPPDLSAGSFRAVALVDALLEELPDDVGIDVLTTLPNRYRSFERDAPEVEVHGRLRIRRIGIPPHSGGMMDQARSFLRFARAGVRVGRREGRYDLIFATSSRLMTAALGAWIGRRTGSPVYLDIRDLFVDTIEEVLSWKGTILRPPLELLEKWTIRTAEHVNLVSPGFGTYFEERYPDQSVSCFTNGIDQRFLEDARSREEETRARTAPGSPLRIVYAGNMGEGQGLHQIIPPLAPRLEGRVQFKLIGDGGRRDRLQKALDQAGIRNVELASPVPRARLIDEYRASDVLFLHLNDYEAFEKVLPSKIFEYAAVGKPIWAGVGGYAARFLRDEVSNAAVFPPCDPDAAIRALGDLELGDRPRTAFVEKYRRDKIMTEMARHIRGFLTSAATP